MKIGVMLPLDEAEETQAVPSWGELRGVALKAEDAGLDSVWVFDHFFYDPEDGTRVVGQYEAWTVLSALAAVTERVEIGALVLCNNFRDPGLVAKMAATADEISGGRIVLGLGAGWHDSEYDVLGLPKDHRVGRFEEALQIIAPLVDGGGPVTFEGRYYTTTEARLIPPPSRPVPILIAGEGPRMLGLTARYAQAWNTAWYGFPDERMYEMFGAMDAAMAAEGRDPAAMTKTVGITIRDPELPPDPEEPAVPLEEGEIIRALAEYEVAGAQHLISTLIPCDGAAVDIVCRAVEAYRAGPRE